MIPNIEDMSVSMLVIELAAWAGQDNAALRPREDWDRHHAVAAELDRRFEALKAAAS